MTGTIGAALVVVVLLGAGLAIWLPNRREDIPGADIQPSCTVVDSKYKFNCHPDGRATRESCERRGCCFEPESDQNVTDSSLINSRFVGVPSCYYPSNYNGYKTVEVIGNGNSFGAILERDTSSGFPRDVKRVVLTVTPIDDYQLRIQIKQKDANRFEPDVDVYYSIQNNRTELYVPVFANNILQVRRKSTNQTVFYTDLSRMVFSDQFLQLSTVVSSKYLYGLGEQKEGMLKDFNWTRYTLFNQGDLPVPNRNLYGSHPFFMIMEPDGKANGVFLLNSNAIDYILQPANAVTIRAVGGIFDFFLFLGPKPEDVVSRYTLLFGRPNFPPRWSMGFHICKYGYFSLEKTVEVLNRNLEAGIPIDVQWHDIDYMKDHLDFTYDPDNFTDLPAFVKELHQNGRRYVAMISPGVSNTEKPGSYPPYDDAKRLDLFIKDTEGKDIEGKVWNENNTVFPDFSNPATPQYWKNQFERFYSELKFDGVWIDMNEPLNFMNSTTQDCPPSAFDNPPYLPGRPYPLSTLTLCMSAKHNKTLHYNEHNLLAYREAKATHASGTVDNVRQCTARLMQQYIEENAVICMAHSPDRTIIKYAAMKDITKQRPFIISRATFAGQGVYSGHWSGDITSNYDDMKYSISAMLTFSLFGMPMTGSDICGFRERTTEELCTRWQSLGAFYPFSRNHNDFDVGDQDPVAMGSMVVSATKKALRIRYYLLPYLYTLFYKNHVNGETVARPLFFEFPQDRNTYSIEDGFLWGPALLIMPALDQGIVTINPYVPAGVWYNLEGTRAYTSKGERIPFEAKLGDINVLLRGGYILPAQIPGNTTKDSALNPFDVLVALDSEKKAWGELFWDDGESIGTYENKKYNLVEMKADGNVLQLSAKHKGYKHDMNLQNIKVYGVNAVVTEVTINGDSVDYLLVEKLLRINGTGHSLLEDSILIKWG